MQWSISDFVKRGRRYLLRAVRATYRTRLRPLLPTIGYPVWSEVRVSAPRKAFDRLVPAGWKPSGLDDNPVYESALVRAIRRHVREAENVVVIGGGYGVTTVVAARTVGVNGKVTCFEAASERIEDIKKALDLNRIDTPVRVEHAIVGRAVSLFGPSGGAPIVNTEELPVCDVLEMDCEGAEVEILKSLRFRPRLILVETHGALGAPTEETRQLLTDLSYSVEDVGPAQENMEDFCIANDIRVLVAQRRWA